MPEVLAATPQAKVAWIEDRDSVGKLVHEAWMREKQRGGFADHPWTDTDSPGWCKLCRNSIDKAHHHPDMLPYEELSPENQAYDWASGEVAYFVGYARAEAKGAELQAAVATLITHLRTWERAITWGHEETLFDESQYLGPALRAVETLLEKVAR